MRSKTWSLALAVVVELLAGCSSDPNGTDENQAYYATENLRCDQSLVSVASNHTIERIGGLVTDDFVVRFAESTRLGVVALVDRNTAQAFDELNSTYGVAVVARDAQDNDPKTIRGFQQIHRLVDGACKDAG